jgi:hypothetical protein
MDETLTPAECAEMETLCESLIERARHETEGMAQETLVNSIKIAYRDGDLDSLRTYNNLFPIPIRLNHLNAAIRSIHRSGMQASEILTNDGAVCYIELRHAVIDTKENTRIDERNLSLWEILTDYPGSEPLLLSFIKDRQITDGAALREMLAESAKYQPALTEGML